MDHQVVELLLITIPLPKIRILPYCLQGLVGEPCLNVAVANEVLGQNQRALDWAKKSYELYRDKLGRDYSKILIPILVGLPL